MTGYDPIRLGGLRRLAERAVEDLRRLRSDDPAAAGATAVARATVADVEQHCLGLIGRIERSDPMGSWSTVLGAAGASSWRRWPADPPPPPIEPGDGWKPMGDVVERVDDIVDVGEVIVACADGGDDCAPAILELGYDVVASAMLTPAGAEVTKYLAYWSMLAVGGMMEQSPSITPDWSGTGGAPGVPPYDNDGAPARAQQAPNGANSNGSASYGDGPNCAGLELYEIDPQGC
ncbi:MAG: hypothetical protein ACRDZ2_00010 [Ilumatobacteraceae bacterium]